MHMIALWAQGGWQIGVCAREGNASTVSGVAPIPRGRMPAFSRTFDVTAGREQERYHGISVSDSSPRQSSAERGRCGACTAWMAVEVATALGRCQPGLWLSRTVWAD